MKGGSSIFAPSPNISKLACMKDPYGNMNFLGKKKILTWSYSPVRSISNIGIFWKSQNCNYPVGLIFYEKFNSFGKKICFNPQIAPGTKRKQIFQNLYLKRPFFYFSDWLGFPFLAVEFFFPFTPPDVRDTLPNMWVKKKVWEVDSFI